MAKSLLNVVVLISGNGTNLQALIDACPASNYQITAVISNDPRALGLERAKKSGIETLAIEPESFSSRVEFDSFLADDVSVEEFYSVRIPQIQTRASDVSFLIDTITLLKSQGHFYAKNCDIEKIGIFGHSFGGGTAALSSNNDDRIKFKSELIASADY